MNSLLLGAQYITEEDRRHLSFCEELVTEEYIRDFTKHVTITDICISKVAMFPAHQVLRYSIILAFASMKSRDFSETTIYGYSIAIHSNIARGRIQLDINDENVFCISSCQNDYHYWEISYLSPVFFYEGDMYGDVYIAAILKACNDKKNKKKNHKGFG